MKEGAKTLAIPLMSLATDRATDSKLHKSGGQACAVLVPTESEAEYMQREGCAAPRYRRRGLGQESQPSWDELVCL